METKVFLNRYRLSLGRNGLPVELHRTPQGITYRAHEIESGREVAVELIPGTSANPADRARLRDAAAAAKQINHANIPVLRDFDLEDDQQVYVTDLFDGHTAEAWVAARGPLPLGAVLRVALQVASAFGAASFHRLQHPAINPGNIIFVPGQTAEGDWPAIKILHWLGPNETLAEGADSRADAAARYASPERLRGGEADFASSIFSLGCTMWFLLTGAPPAVPGATGVRASVPSMRGVPKIVRHLLGRMLRLDPSERPQDPIVLQAYLQTCLARVERRETMSRRFGLPLATTAKAAPAATHQPAFRLPARTLAIAAALLLLGTLAVVALPKVLRARRVSNRTEPRENVAAQARNDAPNDESTETAPPAEGPEGRVVLRDEVQPSPAIQPNESVDAPRLAAATVASLPTDEPHAVAEIPAAVPRTETSEPATEENTGIATPSPNFEPTEVATTEPAVPTPIVRAEEPEVAVENVARPPVVAESTRAAVPSETPRARVAKVTTEKSVRKSRKPAVVAQSKKAKTHSSKKSRLARAEVRRGRKIPQLRVGSKRAELVGTTSDGRWILSVSSSGERIVVPPPPGYTP